METKEYFQRIIDYEDKENMYHPDQIDKNKDIDFVKMAYRAMYDLRDFDKKNMAKNYLTKLEELENGKKNRKRDGK